MKPWEWALVLGIVGLVAYTAITGDNLADDVLDSLPGGGGSDGSGSGGVGSTILGALASFENVASQHNNPGGICGSFTNGACNGPATFASLEAGTDAAVSKIEGWISANPAITVEQFVAKWSGATGQVLQNYVASVSSALGLDPNEPIADAGGDDDGN
jgi:hypothetical protein